jgi:putative NADH-flavin reductase
MVVAHALEAGHAVTGLQRRSDPAAQARLVVGDATDPASLCATVEGADLVICALGAGAGGPADVCSRATELLVPILERDGPRRLVCLTGAMVGHARDRMATLYGAMESLFPALRRQLVERRAQERRVRGSALDWTIVRPARLTDGPATGECRASEDVWVGAFSSVSRADLAAFLVERAPSRDFVRRSVAVIGA